MRQQREREKRRLQWGGEDACNGAASTRERGGPKPRRLSCGRGPRPRQRSMLGTGPSAIHVGPYEVGQASPRETQASTQPLQHPANSLRKARTGPCVSGGGLGQHNLRNEPLHGGRPMRGERPRITGRRASFHRATLTVPDRGGVRELRGVCLLSAPHYVCGWRHDYVTTALHCTDTLSFPASCCARTRVRVRVLVSIPWPGVFL